MIFVIKPVIVLKKNLIVNPSTIFFFLKTKRSYNDKATDFHIRKIPKAGSNYLCLSVMLTDCILKKMETIICECF